MRNFQVLEIGTIAATENNIATVIDVSTQSFRLAPYLTDIVAAARWASRDNLRENMAKLQAAVEAIKPIAARLPRYEYSEHTELMQSSYHIPAPALHAARALFGQFEFSRLAKLAATERNVAILIDVCTNIGRVMTAINELSLRSLVPRSDEFSERLDLVRRALRATELARNCLPSRSQAVRVTLREKREVELKLTRQQIREASALAAKVSAASTVDDQVRLLMKAGYVRT